VTGSGLEASKFDGEIEEEELGGAFSTLEGDEKCAQNFSWKT
jgi:hypothetical protein